MTTATKKKFYIKHFESEISAIATHIHNFKKSGYRADDDFLEVGNLLIQTKYERHLDDEIFTRLKAHIAKLVGRHGLRDVNKVVAIAQCDIIQCHKKELPKDWNLLYLLSKQENLAELIASNTIKSSTSVELALKQLKKVSNMNSKKWLLRNEVMYTGEDVEKLRTLLSTSCWMIQNRHAKNHVQASM